MVHAVQRQCFRILDLGVSGVGVGTTNMWMCSRFEVQDSGLRVQGSWFGVQGFRVQGFGFRVQSSGLRVQGSGFRVEGSGFRVEGFREPNSGCSPKVWMRPGIESVGRWFRRQAVQGYLAHKKSLLPLGLP